MSGGDIRADRHALLELDALLGHMAGVDPYVAQPWARLYQLRNKLAHRRLSDIDEDEVWRMTAVRPGPMRELVRGLLR